MFLHGVDTDKMHAGVSPWSVWDVSQSSVSDSNSAT